MEMIILMIVIVIVCILVYSYRRRQKISDFPNRHVFVTGCDSGFGNLLAIRLDEMGFHVYAGCLTKNGEEDLRKKTSSRLVTVPLDISNEKSIEEALKLVRERLPTGKGLWGLVNNAGILDSIGMAEWLRKEDYKRTLEVNFFGTVEMTRMFLPLIRQARGRVINMSSIVASVPFPLVLPYCISKHAVEVFSDVLRVETQLYGVTVHLIKPDGFSTNMNNKNWQTDLLEVVFNRADEDVKALYGDDYPARLLEAFSRPGVSDKIYLVVDAYVDALVSMYPRDRYLVGSIGTIVRRILPWAMPTWLQKYYVSGFLPKLAAHRRSDH
ncbi:retinol dehydrogenase 7-like [Liolophura sinensis]|uniref:retinol dehydrogenase 7-like n=1 Tax=Liolophura sinensis TaxID=3198878 RepID=UPI00315813A2